MEGAILARQAAAKSSAEEFLELIQNPFSAAFQLNAFWASFGTSLGLTIVLALCFSFVRPRNSLVYAPKIKHADRKHSPPPVGKGLLAWLTPVIQTKESNLVDCIGLDATVFLRFTRMCRNMFLVLSIIGCLVMIPVNVSQSSSPAGISAFATMTPQFVSTRAMWSHVVCLWIFDVVVAYFLWRNYKVVSALRRHYFESSDYQESLHAKTLLIRHVPPDFRTDDGLLRLVDDINPTSSVPLTSIGRNMKQLPKLIAEHEKTVRQLEEVLAKYFKNPDRLPVKRPTCRPFKADQAARGSDRIDAIDYLTSRIGDLEAEIKHVRESINTVNAMPYGFASWESIEAAHFVAYTARNKHPRGSSITLAPRPNDIIWENLALSRKSRKWKRIINFFWSTVLTVLWIAPNALIAIFLSNLSNLGKVWPAFRKELYANPKTWAAVQGIAAPAVTSFVYLVLPIIFRRLSIRAGDITKTSRERHVIHSLYAFFVFNNLVVFSIFSAIWTFVATVIEAKNNNDDTWDAILKGQFFFQVATALCNVSPFWVTWILQRNLGATLDLLQIFNLTWIWFAKRFLTTTPRQAIEWTAPPPFQFASYYNYFLFYATIALCFSTLQPIILPVTALYFALDSWLKKYLLLYVFVTKTESGGQFWRVLFNRLVFAVILANFAIALVVKAKGTWTMVFCLVPLPFLMLAFKWFCKRSFDDGLTYYSRRIPTDAESLSAGQGGKKASERIASKFGHPALYKPLMTPMVFAKAAGVLEKNFQPRQGGDTSGISQNSDIALQKMSSKEPGRTSSSPDDAPFEVIPENQLDFSYFKDRPDFRDEFGGGIYGRPDDLINERSHTPRNFFNNGFDSPGSSRASSPVRHSNGAWAQGNGPAMRPSGRMYAQPFDSQAPPPPVPHGPVNPEYRSGDNNPEFHSGVTADNESERALLSNDEARPVQYSADIASHGRWENRRSRGPRGLPRTRGGYEDTSYETYRGVQY
ncbi:DUF221 domain-containing protein [Histoplasma capsulatum G186AR]|uniref:DUF221 domain-containing protein n=2 Tax=Ajellomyces capsulatus TaxID=5037 RepID=C0NUY3_AJECG|nr:DUF221 domain-containing protein [Histoplasma capsulatum G186AR]EEH04796.1 DUF221 domain-containing protein [Histoplasma capsulatum G186AR]KAG5287452.1 DUF221 domain-containing protein [Histoplasma capsulatum]QSS70735.1 DUF221 domain-containing protein [Histoplasma capsulatum G186AR]